MAENVQDMTLEVLKSIQASVAQIRAEVAQFRAETNERFQHLDDTLRKHRRDGAGMLVMMRATAGDFDERVEIEERVGALEAAR